jgi:hypothetical protein
MDVLVVGGEHSFVQGTFATRLKSIGVFIRTHWDWNGNHTPTSLPANCQGVIVLREMVSHGLSNAAKAIAAEANVPFALVSRKWSVALPVLQQIGIVATTPTAPSNDELEKEPTKENGPLEDLSAWVALILESDFAATDRAVADKASEMVPGMPMTTLEDAVRDMRATMRKAWSAKSRSADAERTLRAAMQEWLGRSTFDPEDSQSLARLRSSAQSLFGVPILEELLVGRGYQSWEIRGMLTRERVRTAVRNADAMIAALPPGEFDAFRAWVLQERDNGKSQLAICPLNISLRGLPAEGLTFLLRAVPDINAATATRVYPKMSGTGFGAYYYHAVVWALAQFPAPARVAITPEPPPVVHTPEPPPVINTPEPPPGPAEDPSLLNQLKQVLVGSPASSEADLIQRAKEARTILDALEAAAMSLASGGDAAAINALVQAKAESIKAERSKQELEAAEQEAAEADHAFRHAVQMKEEAETEITRLEQELEEARKTMRSRLCDVNLARNVWSDAIVRVQKLKSQ